MKPPFSYVPALPVALGWMAGIVIFTLTEAVWWPALSVVVGIILMITRRHYVALLFYSLPIGWMAAMFAVPSEAPGECLSGHRVWVSGIVRDSGRSHAIIQIDSIGKEESTMTPVSPFRLYLYSKPDRVSADIGYRLRAAVAPEPAGGRRSFPHDIDYSMMYLRNGVSAKAYIDAIDCDSEQNVGGAASWLFKQRKRIVTALSDSELSDKSYGLLAALLVGHDEDLQSAVRENFRATGIAHALALSGFHVGAIVLLISFLLFPLRALPYKVWIRQAVLLASIWLYAGITGMPASVVRAVIMLSICVIARIISSESNTYNSLCVAIVFILAIWPYSIYTAGLQLSACAVLGIVTFSEPLNPVSERRHYLHSAVSLLTVPVAALLGTMPITVGWFHRLPIYFMLSNLLVSLMLPLLMFGGVALVCGILAGFKMLWFCRVIDYITDSLDGIVGRMASWPSAEIESIYLSAPQLVVMLVLVLILGIAVHWRHRAGWCVLTVVALLYCTTLAACDEKMPRSEAFVVEMRGNTPVVFRHGEDMIVATTCRHVDREDAVRKLLDRLHDFIESRNVRTIRFTNGDFSLGPYSRNGDILSFGKVRVGLVWQPGRVSYGQHAEKVDYVLLCSRYRRGMADVERAFIADTVVLSHDMSHGRRQELKSQTRRPVIEM